jgi:hypothetical protein
MGMNIMDRQTRRTYFERLCVLRDGYGRLGADDITAVISIEAMIELANEIFARRQSALITVVDRGATSA